MQDLRAVTHYDRREHGRGIVSWVYDYWNREAALHAGVATGIELGVQVRGDWEHTGRSSGSSLVGVGEAHHIDVGESYAVRFDARKAKGTQVGFAIYLDELDEGVVDVGPKHELRFVDHSARVDARFLDLCRALDADRELPSEDVRREVLTHVLRRSDVVPRDAIALGKHEIEAFFDRELRIEHIAETAGIHPTTFSRKFKARYGLSPVSYRTRWRLFNAGRLLWSRHDLSIREVAEQSGMADMPYFYRGFQKTFGSTPAIYRERSLLPLACDDAGSR